MWLIQSTPRFGFRRSRCSTLNRNFDFSRLQYSMCPSDDSLSNYLKYSNCANRRRRWYKHLAMLLDHFWIVLDIWDVLWIHLLLYSILEYYTSCFLRFFDGPLNSRIKNTLCSSIQTFVEKTRERNSEVYRSGITISWRRIEWS